MLDRSPQPNLFDPGRAGEPAPQATPAPQAPHDHFPPPAAKHVRRRRAPSFASYLAAARATIAPALSGRLHPPRRLRVLAPAAILLLLLVLNPAGCGRSTTTSAVTQTTGAQQPARVITRLVTRTVTVRQPPTAVTPLPQSHLTAAAMPAHTRQARTALTVRPAGSPGRQPTVTATTSPTSTEVTPPPTTDSPPDPSREESGEEFGFER
jgi:hypothetical protein